MALKGINVVELAGLAPSPFLGMILADFGANVIRIDKISSYNPDSLCRGKQSLAINLKKEEGQSIVRKICKNSDVLIEPFRAGVMEKLNLSPDILLRDNPKLIYCRMTGYGQKGPMKSYAGHDINYIATSGVLSALKWGNNKPNPPVNLLADFAGGGLLAAFGVLAALLERTKSGKGQVIDANMVQGSAYVSSFLFCYRSIFPNPPGENPLDGGSPFYDTYQTKDEKFVAVGAIEPQFYDSFIKGLKLDPKSLPHQLDASSWPETRCKIAKIISSYTQKELISIFGDDESSCVTPVLDFCEAANLPHNIVNKTFHLDKKDNKIVPNPAPILSRTPGVAESKQEPDIGQHSYDILKKYYKKDQIEDFISKGVVFAKKSSKL